MRMEGKEINCTRFLVITPIPYGHHREENSLWNAPSTFHAAPSGEVGGGGGGGGGKDWKEDQERMSSLKLMRQLKYSTCIIMEKLHSIQVQLHVITTLSSLILIFCIFTTFTQCVLMCGPG